MSEANPATESTTSDPPASAVQTESRSWSVLNCVSLLIQPLLVAGAGIVVLLCLAFIQSLGFLLPAADGVVTTSVSDKAVQYICPMMCTPPTGEPGRCPVCAMELVPSTSSSGGDSDYVEIDAAARRIANIQTAPVQLVTAQRTIRAVGQIQYDEAKLKTISAYVDGRVDKLYADYTGVIVKKGDTLAWLYSPELYAAQVEFLLAQKTVSTQSSGVLPAVAKANQNIYSGAEQKLAELGMTDPQIQELKAVGEPSKHVHLSATLDGTVIELLTSEGQYTKAGEAIYKIADLSTVWLILELFPEDAAHIRYGQRVEAEVQSLIGKQFVGRVAFIDPHVDERKRTVAVRVVFPNEEGNLRVGDFAKATISLPIQRGPDAVQYDDELAGRWISPRHPNIVQDESGECPLSGQKLRPAADFGFLESAADVTKALVIPQDAVLMAGDHSVVYVETSLGRFEFRPVKTGACCGSDIVILEGLQEGELVATRGNFLIDSQMQLAGNASLIDPTKYKSGNNSQQSEELSPKVLAALEELTPEDRELAMSQQLCPVADYQLGSMGPPVKVEVKGRTVFLCCEGCRGSLLKTPAVYFAKLDAAKNSETQAAESDLPPIGMPIMIEPISESDSNASDLPPIGPIQAFESAEDEVQR